MGIDVDKINLIVTYNNSHEKNVDTSKFSSANWKRKKSVMTASLLLRRRTSDKIDGNPLIYSMKKLKGYKIDKNNLIPIIKNSLHNLNITLRGKNYDLIIAIPSQASIVKLLANRIKKRITNAKLSEYILTKQTNKEIISSFNMGLVKRQHKREVKNTLHILSLKPGNRFILKEISGRIRHYFNPLKIRNPYYLKTYTNILIVDDALSSGTTLYNAQKMIKDINPNANVEAICLLSSVH